MPHFCQSQYPSASALLGGKAAFPICPACDAQALKAVIHLPEAATPDTALISACRWQAVG
jgi:hypothetical protein